ncbi:hypothetical protein [Aeromicrobium sp. UC242_57]|uniref:hypothetical protein n=1 Tax=Aeromicrobium sp. UC242_57 TaxID=3374624 RepID=UPI0037907178
MWICSVPNGHLQAVGTDAAGRRQYLYHPAWRERRDAEKFDRIVDFADELLRRRARARRALGAGDLGLEQVSAAAFCLLDLGMFRVGSAIYVEENGSYGLTTLEKSHVDITGSRATFAYAAKSGQDVEVSVGDRQVVSVLTALRRRRGGGDRLLAYRTGRTWHDLTAEDVNAYVKDLLGREPFGQGLPHLAGYLGGCPGTREVRSQHRGPAQEGGRAPRCAPCRTISATPRPSRARRTSIRGSSTCSSKVSRSIRRIGPCRQERRWDARWNARSWRFSGTAPNEYRRVMSVEWRAALVEKIRSLIERAEPDVVEEVKWRKPSNPDGVPTFSCAGLVCTVRPTRTRSR